MVFYAVRELHAHRVSFARVRAERQPTASLGHAEQGPEADWPLALVHPQVRRLVVAMQPKPQPHAPIVARTVGVVLPPFLVQTPVTVPGVGNFEDRGREPTFAPPDEGGVADAPVLERHLLLRLVAPVMIVRLQQVLLRRSHSMDEL